MGGAGSIQHRHGLLRPALTRPLPLRPVLGGRGRVHRRIHLLGSAAACEPALECARRPRRKTRGPRRHHPAATPGPPKGALMPQRVLLGNLPGFVHSHDLFPLEGDLFWSPADWAWTGGLMDALLPSLYHGIPLLGYRGRFDPEKSFWLMQKYGVRNAFLFPTALKMMMKTVPQPAKRYELSLRSIMSAGESVGETVFEWSREAIGITVNEMFGQTENNYIVGNSHTLWTDNPVETRIHYS